MLSCETGQARRVPDHLGVNGPRERPEVAAIEHAFRAARGQVGRFLRLPRLSRRSGWLLAALVLVAWVAAGIYKVQPDEQGVVLRFGHWTTTEQPGLHYHLPYPIETVLLPKVTSVNQLRIGGTLPDRLASRPIQILTGDENLVEAEYSVFWKVKDAGRYLFGMSDPEGMLRTAAESALREVIGRNPIQSALSDRRQQIADAAQEELQRLLDAHQAGILIVQVQLQRVDPPSAVIDAFNDVQRARADQERARNEAEAYRNDILPRARGEAQRIIQAAEGYKAQVVYDAQGELQSYLSVYQAYRTSPDGVAWRLYLDSVDQILRKAAKVVIDSSGKGVAGVVPYMPLADVPRPVQPEAKGETKEKTK